VPGKPRLDERQVDQRSIVVNAANRSIVFAIDDFSHLAGEPRRILLQYFARAVLF